MVADAATYWATIAQVVVVLTLALSIEARGLLRLFERVPQPWESVLRALLLVFAVLLVGILAVALTQLTTGDADMTDAVGVNATVIVLAFALVAGRLLVVANLRGSARDD